MGNVRNKRTTFPKVQARRERAAQRQAAADKRKPEDQLRHLNFMGLTAVKERLKLAKRIAETKGVN